MKTIVKILLEFDEADHIAARRKFQEVAEMLEPELPADCRIRAFKMVVDGTGQLIDAIDPDPAD